jgi:RNAse (barnase) inhibitor barstar
MVDGFFRRFEELREFGEKFVKNLSSLWLLNVEVMFFLSNSFYQFQVELFGF